MMMSLPIKMYLRWIFNLKYLVSHPRVRVQHMKRVDG